MNKYSKCGQYRLCNHCNGISPFLMTKEMAEKRGELLCIEADECYIKLIGEEHIKTITKQGGG